MKKSSIKISGVNIPVNTLDTIVIGSGCAGLNAADWLQDLGKDNIAIVTEGINLGTSRNTGSDKQTYYKLSLSSSEQDSVLDMAKALFEGKGVNGDTALIEAACSVKSFIKLANLGVPFPTNTYGEYVGYMTDHDSHKRATSAGPLTSKYMTEALEESVRRKNITIVDNTLVVKLLTDNKKVIGAIGIDKKSIYKENHGLVLFICNNIILATGGPAGIYENSVYPCCHTGMSALAIEAGAKTANFQEWQYGLASVDFRWNVSGTYQQVLPRYISIDENGHEHEFLNDYFENPADAVNMVFRKGYQWPFDTSKIEGSSVIDMIIFNETVNKKNKVYMDFRHDPTILQNGFDSLSEEARSYLENSAALKTLPIERLRIMNKKAIELYAANGIDLYNEPLRVAVCAQHNNGGIAVDMNWQSDIEGLYIAGEAAGTFGVYRPGGTALNSSQVGSMRAAENISVKKEAIILCDEEKIKVLGKGIFDFVLSMHQGKQYDYSITNKRNGFRTRMSSYAANIRIPEKMVSLKNDAASQFDTALKEFDNTDICNVFQIFKLRDMCLTQECVLSAMLEAANKIGTRGGALVCKNVPRESDIFKMKVTVNTTFDDKIITAFYKNKEIHTEVTNVRLIPHSDLWFEKVWNEYMERRKKQ